MVRIASALLGAAIGLAAGVLMRPTVFGSPVPYEIVFSKEPMDAPFREMMLQGVSFSVIAGAAAAAVVLPLLLQGLPATWRGEPDFTSVDSRDRIPE